MIRQIIIDVCTHVRILYGGNKNHLTDLHLSSRKRKHLNSHIFLIIYIYIYKYMECVYMRIRKRLTYVKQTIKSISY